MGSLEVTHDLADRGYFGAGIVARIVYADGETVENPFYVKIDSYVTTVSAPKSSTCTCYIEALWVAEDGTVRVRREPADSLRLTLRTAPEASE